MTNEELKTAILSGTAVEHNGIEYKCVSAVIYRKKGKKIVVSAELTDKNNKSVSIVDPEKVREV